MSYAVEIFLITCLCAWSVVRAGYMHPGAPMLDKLALAVMGGASFLWLVELVMYQQAVSAQIYLLAGVALWVVPPSARCALRNLIRSPWLARAIGVEVRRD